ncbi:MAG: terpene cyclase/mutase family protein, partial [Deltaproteobacteria bacterium]|nr:terpene cyclase/mutase family protein [Deltaproteobacteria bacterium]
LPADWEARAAGRLDARAGKWLAEPPEVGENYPCAMACHTTHPFMLARPLLAAPGQVAAAARARVEARVAAVADWHDAVPMYGDTGSRKAQESLATEAVLNATSLTLLDVRGGGAPSAAARRALEQMWAMQRADGGWDWLAYDLEPWESAADEPWGAGLAALAVGSVPGYATEAAQVERVARMVSYLRAHRDSAGLHHQLMLVRASLRLAGLLEAPERTAILDALRGKQGQDGGWSLASWGRGVRQDVADSDGYATAFALLVLCESGERGERGASVERGVRWLATHQAADGSWPGRSVNKSAAINQLFMSDAATAYAVMAMAACR